MAQRETALIVPIPDAEALVGSLRSRYDKTASRGIPAHITVLYPFLPPDQIAAAVADIAATLERHATFETAFSRVGRFPRTAFLEPDDPEPFAALTRAIWSRWPAYPPYSGAHSDIVPHLTVADDCDAYVVEEVGRVLMPLLPLRALVNAVWVMESDERGNWQQVREIALGAKRVRDHNSR